MRYSADTYKTLSVQVLLLVAAIPLFVDGQTIPPSPYWKSQITFPDDPFRVAGSSASEPGWVKFTILLEPYDRWIAKLGDAHSYQNIIRLTFAEGSLRELRRHRQYFEFP